MKTLTCSLFAGAGQVFAQGDPLAGAAGAWVGAGLLGAVLSWLLLKHLPDKDRQLTSLLESRDALMGKLLTEERSSCEKRHADNLAESRLERETRDRQHVAIIEELKQVHDEEKEARHAVKDLAQTVTTWIQVVRQITGVKIPNQEEDK